MLNSPVHLGEAPKVPEPGCRKVCLWVWRPLAALASSPAPPEHGLTMSDKGDVVAGALQLGWSSGEMVPQWENRQGLATARCEVDGHSLAISLLFILQEGAFGLWKVRGSGRAGAKAESRLGSVCLASISEVIARLGTPVGECTAQGLVQGEQL